jgi:hypothetical protein
MISIKVNKMCLERGENIEREQLECFGYGWVSML